MNHNVLIAGIGGASLGSEIAKSLFAAGHYNVFGCDVSPFACGLYNTGFAQTFCISETDYVHNLLEICRAHQIRAIIPGGEEPLRLIDQHRAAFDKCGVFVAANSQAVTAVCSDKSAFFDAAERLLIPVPETIWVHRIEELGFPFPLPAIVKPTTGTGGSTDVTIAAEKDAAECAVIDILKTGRSAIVQEYLPDSASEFTVGVLNSPDGRGMGAIAMKRILVPKLSVSFRSKDGVISSGYSQGYFDFFPHICEQARQIAAKLGSRGPLNIQGRLVKGELVVFEINPRFSASTWLRTLAGFNEIDRYLQFCLDGIEQGAWSHRVGYYLRDFTETFVPANRLCYPHIMV